ncbi:MAG: DUF853 family protein [Candidatus Wallbacteria bacterium]|nr:DUF853 family protein [Candidatus Wallbacteria bacterium]
MKNFFLGLQIKLNKLTEEKFTLPIDDFLRHAFICGSTGAGKTVIGKILVEEAAKNGVSSILLDLKGDISSMAIPFINLMPDEVIPWFPVGKSEEEKQEESREFINNYKQKLKFFGMAQDSLKEFRRQSTFYIYTPRSRKGDKFSISELYSGPEDIENYFRQEPEIVAGMIQNMALSVLSRIYPDADPRHMMIENSFLEEIIKHLWLEKSKLEGTAGIERLIDAIKTPPFERIGKLKLDEYFPEEKRMDLVRKLNSLLLGSQRCWFEGKAISQIVKDVYESKETKVVIFNLTELDSFADKSLVVSQLAYSIYNTYRRTHSDELRLLIYLDEIGGSDNNAFFPPEPFYNIAKPALNLLLRQGRAFGVGMVLSTQNPGDIDYKGLTNCHSWFIGRLQTSEDRQKAMEGISRAEMKIEKAEDFIRDAKEGSFLVRTRSGKVHQFMERWLYSIHKIMSDEELENLKKEMQRKQEYLQAYQLFKDGSIDEAISVFRELISKNPTDPGNYFDLAEALKKNGRGAEALSTLRMAETAGISNETLSVKIGELLNAEKKYDEARDYFLKTLDLNPGNDIAHYYLGCIFHHYRDYDKALHHIAMACKNNYQQDSYWYQKAWLTYERGSYNEALNSIEAALNIVPNSEEYYLFKALVFYRLGKKEETEKILPQNICEKPLYHYIRALLELERGKKTEAEADLAAALKQDPGFVPALFEAARISFENKAYIESIQMLNKALEQEPYEPEYWYYTARILKEVRQPAKGLTCLEKALKVKEDYRFYFLQGELLEMLNKKPDAFASFGKSMEFNKKYLPATLHQIEISLSDDPQKALELCKNALKGEYAENPDLYLLKAKALLALNYTREAHQSIDENLKINSKDAEVWMFKASIFKKEANWQKMIDLYQENIKTFGDQPRFYLGILEAMISAGKTDDAVSFCDKALEVFPEDLELWEALCGIYLKLKDEDKANYCRRMISQLKG